MGLFDHLFKHRADSAGERSIEERLRAPGKGGDEPDPQAAFLQPKGYAPGTTNPTLGGQQQGLVPVLPTARRPTRAAAPAAPRETANEIILNFGDVLARIPVQFLRPGPHDLKRELRFQIEDLTSDLARGRTGVALSRIAEQCPDFFQRPITDDDDMEVRLPLQKLVEQVTRIRSGAGSTPFSAPRQPAPAAKNLLPSEAAMPAPFVPPPPTGAVAVPVAAPVAPPPISVVPSPVAVAPPEPPRPAPPAIQETPPPVVPPPVSIDPISIVPISIVPISIVPEVPPAPEPASPAPEPSIPPPPELPVPPVAEAPAPPVEAAAPPPVELPSVPLAPEPLPAAEEPRETPVPAPPPALRVVTEQEIDLSLAAITAGVPAELFAAGRPQIAENYRISLPFAPIERQLGTGQVEVSASTFWDALPPMLRHHFVLHEGAQVTLPLEEIFQNLPVAAVPSHLVPAVASAAAAAAPPPEAPIVLAPAPLVDDQTGLLDFDRPAEVPPEPIAAPAVTAPAVPEPASVIPEPPPQALAEPLPEPAPPVHPPAPVVLAAPEASEPATAPKELAAPAAPAPPPPRVAAAEENLAPVQLPPFRIFTPQVQASESADLIEPAGDQPFVLGQPGAMPAAENPATAAPPSDREVPAPDSAAAAPRVDLAEETVVTSPAPISAGPEPARQATRFSVLPSREIAARAEDIEGVVAFNADQPPPLTVAPPAAAVAVLHATIPSPPPAMVSVSAGPTTSVQPPRMFRPVVLPPPISGHTPTAPLNLAPTLGGTPLPSPGLISLAPAPVVAAAAPPPKVEPPVEIPRPPVLAANPPPAPLPTAREPLPPPPVAVLPVPPPPAAPAPAAEPPGLHLHLPPLPAAAPVPVAAHEPPPALPISRFDQHSLQSLFMTDETLDTPKVARLAAALPGIEACIISARGESISGGNVPAGFELGTLRGLAPQVGAAAERLPIGELKNFTLFGATFSVSFFERGPVCLVVVHRARSFVPGVREKLVAVTEELAR